MNQVVFNLRFPGQYADSELDSNLNYFRTYLPMYGRYLQSDPILPGVGLRLENSVLTQQVILGKAAQKPSAYGFVAVRAFYQAGGLETRSIGYTAYPYSSNNPITFIDPLGLSRLHFNSAVGIVILFDRNERRAAEYPAGNRTTNPWGDPFSIDSNGPAPPGAYQLQTPIAEPHPSISYGPYFIPIGEIGLFGSRLDIARQRGIGIHGGRSGPGSRTEGCIRLSNDNIIDIVEFHQIDPLTEISIE